MVAEHASTKDALQYFECLPGPPMRGLASLSAWLLDMTMNQHAADAYPVFRIDHPDLKGLLALQIHAGPPMRVEFKDIYLKNL